MLVMSCCSALSAKSGQGAPVASFLLLEKRDDGFANGCVLLFVEHDSAGNERLGIGQIGIEVLLVPDEIDLGISRRVVEACEAPGLAAIDAGQHGSLARRIMPRSANGMWRIAA